MDRVARIVERVAARTKYLKVEPTTPGSKNHYKITYHDGTEKWVDTRPGRGMPSRREQRLLRRKMRAPSVQRAINRLDDAMEGWKKDEKPEPLQQAVEKNEVGLDKELAKTVNRLFVKTVREHEGEDIDETTKKGLEIVKDHVNRFRRDAVDRMERIATKVAQTSTAGTWALPDTPWKARQFREVVEMLKRGEFPNDKDEVKDYLYPLLGDDELFDNLDRLGSQYCRSCADAVVKRIKRLAAQKVEMFKNSEGRDFLAELAKIL